MILEPNQVLIKSIKLADDITTFNQNLNQSITGTIKINTDGSARSLLSSLHAKFGSFARSANGEWIEGFCGYIGVASPLKAEL